MMAWPNWLIAIDFGIMSPRVVRGKLDRVQIFNPFSLKEICVQFVSNNVEKWSVAVNSSNKCDQEEIFSPLEVLPSVLLEDIRFELYQYPVPESLLMKKQVTESIITPHLKYLNLIEPEVEDVPCLLHLASLRCPDLKAVNLQYTHLDDNIEICVHLCALKFEKLQMLNISGTDAEDSCLQVLGMHCKDLRELNVDFCSKITDAGIKGLCVSGICKSIEGLWIRGTQITKKGIQIALKHLHFLRALKVSNHYGDEYLEGCVSSVPVQIIAEMISDLQDSDLKRKYSLNCLCNFAVCDLLGHMTYINGSLGLVASLCPFVTFLNIDLETDMTDRDLLELLSLSLENVNRLEIHDFCAPSLRDHEVTFEDGVVPLLKKFGSSLERLVLSNLKGVTAVNIPMIIDFCPKLKSLDINDIN